MPMIARMEKSGTMPVKAGFVLLSNSGQPAPSTRIAVLNMFPFLRKAGFEPCILFEPPPGRDSETPDVSGVARKAIEEGVRVVLIQKVRGPSVLAMARELKAAGVKTVYQVCDLVDPEMVAATDLATTTTEYLRSLFPEELRHKIHLVHDGIEHHEIQKTEWSTHHGSRLHPLRAVLVTSLSLDNMPVLGKLPEWLSVTVVGRYPPSSKIVQRLRETYWKYASIKDAEKRKAYLRFIADRRIRCVAWDPVGVYEHLKRADIGIIPVDTAPDFRPDLKQPSFWQLKSENRLTMKMCIGLPVIATPIPSYEPVIEQGRNGFLATSLEEWMLDLETLRDPEVRREIGGRARASVVHRFSMNEQARLLIDVLTKGLGIPQTFH